MPTSFEQLIFEILATDKGASAAFDRFRQKVDQTSKSVDENSKKLDENSKSIDKLGKSAGSATPLLGSLAGTGGMGLLIGAGAALSPVIATVGAGLGGLGLAAFGAVAPVLKAAKAAGGLQANMAKLNPEQQKLAQSILGLGKQYSAFEKALQPQVLGIFGQGIKIAGHLMGDLMPIAHNTGVALEQVLGRIDAEFKSGTWQQFFNFMAQQAGPDVKLLGNLIIDLTKTLPPLMEDLNPTAILLLKIADAAAKAADAYASFIKAEAHKGNQPGSFGKQIRDLIHDLTRTSVPAAAKNAATGFQSVAAQLRSLSTGVDVSQQSFASLVHPLKTATDNFSALVHPVGAASSGFLSLAGKTGKVKDNFTTLTHPLDTAAGGIFTAGKNAKGTSEHFRILADTTQATADAVNNLTAAQSKSLNTQLAYTNALIASGNDAKTLRQALRASGGEVGYLTTNQRASFSAANTYISDLSNAAKQAVASGKGATGAASAIRAGLPILEQAARHNHALWQEVQTLKNWLDKLRREGPISEKINVLGLGKWSATAATHAIAQGPFPGAEGMRVPGTGNRDTVHALLTPGEAVVPTRLVPVLAPFLRAHGVPGFAGGGIVPSYHGSTGGLKPWANRDMNVAAGQILSGIGNAMANAFRNAFTASQVHGFGAGVGQWAGLVRRVLGMEGLPFGDAGTILSQIGSESGGNPNAINLWDINAQRGDPSRGLLQVIGGTFSRYHWPGTSWNIYDPLANVAAGVNYAVHTYGNPGFLSVLGHGHGYDSGGWLPPGPSLAWNGTGQPERVLPPGRGGGPLMVIEHLHVREAADVDLLARRLAFLDN